MLLSLLGGYLVKVLQFEAELVDGIADDAGSSSGKETFRTSCCEAAAFTGKLFQGVVHPIVLWVP